jgi:signal transduction histidine kinase/ligand-binding sensor domain-containing protein
MLVCPYISGLDPSQKISQYGHNMWRIQDGYLPAPPEAIAQTKDGYLWIGTDAGLVRFDGLHFVPWVSPSGEKLPSDQVHYLLGASDGSLWIGTAKGLARWKDGSLTTYKDLSNRIWGIVEDHGHHIWIARWGIEDTRGPLCEIQGADVHCFGKSDGIPLPTATGLALDDSGNFWISGSQGLCKWKPGTPAVYFHHEIANRGYLMGVDALSVQGESQAWIGLQQPDGNLQLQELADGKWITHPLSKAQGPPPSTNTLFRDPEGTLWVGTASDGVYRIVDGKTDRFSSADGLSSDSVQQFFRDREGILWVATTKGVDSFRELPVVSYSIKEGLVSDSVSTILAAHDGGVWIGGAEALGLLKQDKLSAIRTNHGLPGRDITTMSEDRLGRLWIGVDSNFSVFDHGHFLPIHKPDGSSLGIVFGIAEDAAGNEWAMTNGKLFRIEDLTVRQEINLPQPCFSIASDFKEGVWLGCENGSLLHYVGDRPEIFPRVSTANIRQLLPEPDGGFWAVSEGTLIWWHNNRSNSDSNKDLHKDSNTEKPAVMTAANGLPCNELYAAVKDNAGSLWIYARCGLFSISALDLSRWQQNPSLHVSTEILDVYDGTQPGITPLQPQATRSLDGRLWFANNNLVQTFDPRKWKKNALPPNVVVERITANDVSYPVQHDLKLPAHIRNLEVDYTALSFVVPQKVRFRYKLEGQDNQWQDSRGRRQAFYTDLKPGDYTFRVVACNNDGVWNETGVSLSFAVTPAFDQTVWFRALCLIAAVAVLWVLSWLRLRQATARLHQRLAAQMEERERIAHDLHDTFFQAIQGLLLRFHTATSKLRKDEPMRQIFEETLRQSDQVMLEGREMVLDLRATVSEQNDLPAALANFGEAMRKGNPASFSVLVNGSPRHLHPVVFEEIFKIGKEALGNAFRHSGANNIEAELNYERSELRLRIRDDGSGIDAAILRQGHREGHFGLPGMRERAQKIGAHLDVWGRPGAGTEIELRIAAAIAYAHESHGPGLWKLRRLWPGTKPDRISREKEHTRS